MDAEEYKMKISRDWKAVVDYAREEGFKRGKERAIAKCAKGAKMMELPWTLLSMHQGLLKSKLIICRKIQYTSRRCSVRRNHSPIAFP